MVDLGGLGTIVTFLLIGLVSGGLLRRIGISPIVGYLIAGAMIGEHGLGLVHESKTTHLLAEAGVIFLLFDIGLHLSLRDLWASRRDLFVFGPSQVLICAIVIGGVLYASGLPASAAVIAAGALALPGFRSGPVLGRIGGASRRTSDRRIGVRHGGRTGNICRRSLNGDRGFNGPFRNHDLGHPRLQSGAVGIGSP